MRICLAASGGGHLRQLLDLEPLWGPYDHFFVTEGLALGESIAAEHRTHFVAHMALGQARLGAPFRMLWAALRNLVQSFRLVARERPDIVITTGAGSVFFATLFARLFGARVVLIDSFARFEGRSVFARVADPLAHVRIAQSEGVHRSWPRSVLFDPFRTLPAPTRARRALVFVTVGATLPFDRLIETAAAVRRSGHLPEEAIVQVGVGGARPAEFDAVETLPFGEVKRILAEADIVLCHGGTGSLITALREGCRVIAMPRRFDRGEHYDDHQAEIVAAFVQRGLIDSADTPEELVAALERARARTPVAATTDASALIDYLRARLFGAETAPHGAGPRP